MQENIDKVAFDGRRNNSITFQPSLFKNNLSLKPNEILTRLAILWRRPQLICFHKLGANAFLQQSSWSFLIKRCIWERSFPGIMVRKCHYCGHYASLWFIVASRIYKGTLNILVSSILSFIPLLHLWDSKKEWKTRVWHLHIYESGDYIKWIFLLEKVNWHFSYLNNS